MNSSEYFRAHMPREWLPLYHEQTVKAQEFAEQRIRQVEQVRWHRR